MSAIRLVILSLVSFFIAVPSQASTYATLNAQMAQGCPVAWEDLAVSINSALPTGDLWAGNVADRDAFVAIYTTENPGLTAGQIQLDADNLLIVASECASFRLAVLDELLSQTSTDINAATTEAGNSGLITLMQDRFLTGDVRVTGRPSAADGWVFLTGQTIGNTGSAADLTGSEYEDLFNMAKGWAPNTGSEDFNAGGVVTLPDMRGRGLYGADNMGGVAANNLNVTGADTLGSVVGSESQTLDESQLPSHSHTMSGAGEHTHTLTDEGSHQHKLRTSIYAGSSSGRSDYSYFEGKARPNYQNTIQEAAVRPNLDHSHEMSNPGDHQHTIDPTGGGQPVTTVSPGVVFNVEMKL